jgi:uncharacterized protein YndB with AHSA1/START domain
MATARTEIDAPAARVWDALTDPVQAKEYMFGAEVESDFEPGSAIVWRGEWEGKQYEDKGEVLAFDAPRRLAVTHWSPLTGDADEPANYHHVTYELEPLDGHRTRLTLTHGNSPSQEAADGMITGGWKPVLRGLKDVAENT